MLELQQRAIEFNSIIEKHEKIRYASRLSTLDSEFVHSFASILIVFNF